MESWMPFFVVVTALAVVVQAIVLVVLFLQLRRTAARVERTVADLNMRLDPHSFPNPNSCGGCLPSHLEHRLGRRRTHSSGARPGAESDRILTETMERLRLQLIHVDQILTGAMEAVEEAGSRLRQTIWGPVVKASALIRGIQTGLEFFRAARRGREPAEPPGEHQDEGMFI